MDEKSVTCGEGGKEMKKYSMIGNTHFDPVWLWTWDEAMASIRATFRSALDRMKEDPDFVYSFATPPVFEWIRRTDPALFAEIAERVREGRWELAEGWWVQPDCYSASGESYVRQGLYGQLYLWERFGKRAETVFNIDSFGHSPMLPQILSGSGIKNYCFVRPERHHVTLDEPLFDWISQDGSRVRAYRTEAAYEKDWRESVRKHQTDKDAMIVFGVTDHGGAPTKRAIGEIRESEDALFSTVKDFFEGHEPTWEYLGELLTGDFGPYANDSDIKRRNRVAEYALLRAERATEIANWDERATLRSAWQDVLFNQFHDILGGACIKDAYPHAENMLGRATATADELTHFALQSVTRRIRTPGKNPDTAWNTVLWNLSGEPFRGYVEAEVQWAHEFDWYDGEIALEDGDGVRIEAQVVREKSVIPRFRSRFLFPVEIPSMGYRALRVVQTGGKVEDATAFDPFLISTDRLRVRFSSEGVIEEVFDVRDGTRLSGTLLSPHVYRDDGDTWAFNIDSYGASLGGFEFLGFSVTERGHWMREIRGVYRREDARLEIYYRFYRDTPYFDVRYRVNWEAAHTVLKLECDTESDVHTAAVPAGDVQRGGAKGDLPLGAWVRTGGVTLIPNAAFAYSMKEGKLGVTLLRSPIYGDLRIEEIDLARVYDILDRGIVEGGIRVLFSGDAWREAEAFCNPPTVIAESNHEGDLPSQKSFFSMRKEGVELMALKRAEDGVGSVLRLREREGKRVTVPFCLFGSRYEITLSPWEIATVRLADGACVKSNLLEDF